MPYHSYVCIQNVLYGIFPVILAFTGMSYLLLRFHRKPLSQLQQGFVDPDIQDHLKDVYRFSSQQQVEFLCRVMRKWDLDGVPDPDSTAFGEFVLKVTCVNAAGLLGCDCWRLLVHQTCQLWLMLVHGCMVCASLRNLIPGEGNKC